MTVAGWNWDAAKKAQKERELLTCCYCNAPLEAIMLDTNPRTGEQRFFWACRRTRKDACKFPVGMPPEVFFLKRTAAEKEAGVIPKPDVKRLPPKYRGLYPTIFADEGQSSTAGTRGGTPVPARSAEMSPSCSYSPSTSNSSIASGRSAINHLLTMDDGSRKIRLPVVSVANQDPEASNSRQPSGNLSRCESVASIGGSEPSLVASTASRSTGTSIESPEDTSRATETTSSFLPDSEQKDDASKASEGSSRDACSSTTSEASEGLAELICEQLQYSGVDVSRLEDEELVKKMAGVVKKLHKEKRRCKYPGYCTSAEYRASVDYLFNLDVAPIKRRLKFMSADLTRAVAVMRSNCDLDTMLDAMGGSTPSGEPSMKRAKMMYSKQELKMRVESILRDLASRDTEKQATVTAAAEVPTHQDDPSGAQEWYEGEDGPSTSNANAEDASETDRAEEERLNAIVRSKVSRHVTSSAARRHEHRRRRAEQMSQQQQQEFTPSSDQMLFPEQPAAEFPSQQFNTINHQLPFDSPYPEALEGSSSAEYLPGDVNQQCYDTDMKNDSISGLTTSANLDDLYSSELPNTIGDDDEFNMLFNGYEFTY
ncbi:hypothetical protein Q1695_008521 [Nippostrongylus brasiliensis]|nr:hypothetical protein Q1695_008521 [Nippostrongylus brasiliensis]